MEKKDSQMSDGFIKSIVLLVICFFAYNVLTACTHKPVVEPVKVVEPIAPIKAEEPVKSVAIPLRWEKDHPERIPWTIALFKNIDENFDSLNKAKDLPKFCTKYTSLSVDKKKLLLATIFVELAYYESGFNPKSNSVDVGSKSNKRTWSCGLYQLSSVDSDNWKFPFTYSYEELLTPIKNIHMAVYLMGKIIEKRGVISLKSVKEGLYWAVLSNDPNYKYTKLSKIQAKTQSLEFCN
jgi:hypothetical protein